MMRLKTVFPPTLSYWNGVTDVYFNPDGFYDATPEEAEYLLKCQGVEEVKTSVLPPQSLKKPTQPLNKKKKGR